MTFLENKWILVALVVLCWASSTTLFAGYYYFQYIDLSAKVRTRIVYANLGVDYGNGSEPFWFNETRINAGSTLLDLTTIHVPVNFTEGLTGASINAIDEVQNAYPKFWMWWSWSDYGWTLGQVAFDRYVVGENETILWFFQDISLYPPPPPSH